MKDLLNRAVVQGGMTLIRIDTEAKVMPIVPPHGYQVSLTDDRYDTFEEALEALEALVDTLDFNEMVGIYVASDSRICIEQSKWFFFKDTAMNVAKATKQESIYSWADEDLIWLRYCAVTGEYMTEGYIDEDTGLYYSTLEALLTVYTQQELDEIWADEDGEYVIYWTSWEE